ncbi:hypothetical protein K438DRAFT_1789941 [Mycena galopus ATCC 62051]|nr:hypothetical protein K438DRAFT_1789941 [Mycena galopus ATCC 62051]
MTAERDDLGSDISRGFWLPGTLAKWTDHGKIEFGAARQMAAEHKLELAIARGSLFISSIQVGVNMTKDYKLQLYTHFDKYLPRIEPSGKGEVNEKKSVRGSQCPMGGGDRLHDQLAFGVANLGGGLALLPLVDSYFYTGHYLFLFILKRNLQEGVMSTIFKDKVLITFNNYWTGQLSRDHNGPKIHK